MNMAAAKGVAVLLVILAALGIGYFVGIGQAKHLPTLTGDAVVGDNVATIRVANDSYELRGNVNWTDADGTTRVGDWPECLPMLQEVTGVRFAGATFLHEGGGTSLVVWVDCRNG
jgi:hypothetical protein